MESLSNYITEGGGFLLPMQDFGTSFWKYIQAELKKQDTEVGIAIVNYSTLHTS